MANDSRYRFLRGLLVTATALLIFVAAGVTAYQIYNGYVSTIDNAQQKLLGYAKALEEHVSRVFGETEKTLDIIVDRVASGRGSGLPTEKTLHDIIKSEVAKLPQAAAAFIVDRRGKFKAYSEEMPARRVDVSDRDYFTNLRDDPKADIYISKTVRNRSNNLWRFMIAKKLLDRKGNFVGIAVISFKPEYFENFYKSLNIGPGTRINILRADANTLIVSPFSNASYEQNSPDISLFNKYLHSSPTGFYRSKKFGYDLSDRIAAYSKLSAYPVVALVSVPTEEVLSGWRSGSAKQVVITALLILVFAITSVLLTRQLRKLEESERQLHERALMLAENDERFRFAEGIAHLGSWDWDISKGTLAWSDETYRILGLPPRGFQATQEAFLDRIHPEDVQKVTSAIDNSLKDRSIPYDVEHRIIRPDGTERVVRENGQIFRDEADKPLRMFSVLHDITERKRAQAAFRQSRERYRDLVETANSIILTWDIKGNVTFLNQYAEQFFGFSKEELIGRNIVGTIVPPVESSGRDLERLMNDIRNVPDSFRDSENENITKDGRRVWVRWANRAITDERGKKIGILSIGNDITARKRTEEALRESENRYKVIVESQAEFVVRYLPGGIITFVNDTLCRYVKMAREDLLGKSYYPFMHPDDRGEFVRKVEALDQNNPAMVAEARVVLPDGRVVWHRWSHHAIFDRRGRLLEYQSTGRDFTDLKRAEDALRSSEARFRTIIENASAGILVVDVETKQFRYANPAICRMLGYNEQECRSLTIADLPTEEEVERSIAGVQAHAEGRVHTSERTFRRKDGSSARMSINSVRIELDDRQCLVGFFTDITERNLLEEERLKSQKLEAVGTLAGGIAHDFNNLLQGVFGYISLARLNAARPEKCIAALEQAEKALHLSVRLTNQLLTFSKGGKPVKKTLDLRPVIENATRFSLSGSRSGYRTVITDGLWRTDADEGQIGQVIQNMVLNADQAMPEGGQVEITARNVEFPHVNPSLGLQRGTYIEIAIRDSGIGIPGRYLAKIFDPYFTTKEEGSGLGLATSYSIIKNHGGLIDVKSEVGKGTTFSIYLPAVTAEQQAEPVRPAKEAESGRTAKLLLMDDEQVILDVAGEMIKELGHEVEFAAHGEEAIEKYRVAKQSGKPFDVVILDLTIRGRMGGAETVQRLLEIDPDVRAVVSSGYSDDSGAASHKEQGFKAFLKKPYSIDDLRQMLDTMLM